MISSSNIHLHHNHSQPVPYNQLLFQAQLQSVQLILSPPNRSGILSVANMEIHSERWQKAFNHLKNQLSHSFNKDTLMPELISYLKSLCLINNRKSTIIKQIEFFSFPFLATLSLEGNHLHSIEQIHFMDLPSLKQLFLYRNHIHSLKPLQKCTFPQLSFISLYDNKITETHSMTRLQHKINRLWLEREILQVQNQDISCIVKFVNKTKLTELGIKSQSRISQPKVSDSIHQLNNIHFSIFTYDQST